MLFSASNNAAEYEALIAGLLIVIDLGVPYVKVYTDSQLVVGKTTHEFKAKNSIMKAYKSKVDNLKYAFQGFSIKHVSREQNSQAYALAKLASE